MSYKILFDKHASVFLYIFEKNQDVVVATR